MKSKLLFLSLLLSFIPVTNFAQTSASASGIAIQGIARDNNNTARANATLTLIFTLYEENNPNGFYNTGAISVKTDEFGVFSYVLDPGSDYNARIANNSVWLKIKEGSDIIISNEKLKHVPYAIAANNGVPVGSIMPFVGTEAPVGWALCNGQDLTNIVGSETLIALLGSNNAPNLRGMFLRGTGTSPVNNQDGPALNETQDDGFEKHLHGSGDLKTNVEGNHSHQFDIDAGPGGYGATIASGGKNLTADIGIHTMGGGSHSHTMTGNSAETGTIDETRPVNYGVNYIIKL